MLAYSGHMARAVLDDHVEISWLLLITQIRNQEPRSCLDATSLGGETKSISPTAYKDAGALPTR